MVLGPCYTRYLACYETFVHDTGHVPRPPGYFVAWEDMGTQHDKVKKIIESRHKLRKKIVLALATMGKYNVRGKNRLV